jgi:hypothetical protein
MRTALFKPTPQACVLSHGPTDSLRQQPRVEPGQLFDLSAAESVVSEYVDADAWRILVAVDTAVGKLYPSDAHFGDFAGGGIQLNLDHITLNLIKIAGNSAVLCELISDYDRFTSYRCSARWSSSAVHPSCPRP